MISKVQKEYLEKRLASIRKEKIAEKFPSYSERIPVERYHQAIASGAAKLKSLEVVSCDNHYYDNSIERWFDFSELKAEKERETKFYKDYVYSLDGEILRIMDRVILGNLDVDCAISSLEEF